MGKGDGSLFPFLGNWDMFCAHWERERMCTVYPHLGLFL